MNPLAVQPVTQSLPGMLLFETDAAIPCFGHLSSALRALIQTEREK